MSSSLAKAIDGEAREKNATRQAIQDDLQDVSIKQKYMGSLIDQREMQTLGRVQQLRRNFRFVSMLGLGTSLIATWEFLLALVSFALTDGGTAGLIWGFIIVIAGFVLVYLSLSEMASMAPTSGGQYHWVSEFAPRSCQKYLSYITGYLCATGWQCSVSSTSFLAGTIIQGLLILNDQSYEPKGWHGSLFVMAIASFAVIFNTLLAKQLPLIEWLLLFIHVAGLFAIIIPLWVLAPHKDAKSVFTQFANNGGWSGEGVSVLIGMSQITASMAGFDCAVHMAEEIKDASRTLPNSIMTGVAVNSVLGFLLIVTLSFTLGDVDSILATKTGYPFIQIIYNALNNYAGTDVLVSIVVITFTSAVISEVAAASRQLWSFARDGAVPFSKSLAHVNRFWNIPLNAIIVSLLIASLLSLINIGSTVAFNAINSLTISALLSSYMVTIGCIIIKRLRGEKLPPSRWSLGRWALSINIGGFAFLCVLFVFVFFPLATPVNVTTMNWGIVMYSGIVILATVYYILYGRKQYIPPVALLNREE